MADIGRYRLHRTWHLAKMLDKLQELGDLSWSYQYNNAASKAEFVIAVADGSERTLGTKDAEHVAQRLTNARRIIWLPVPHWGGEENWVKTIAQMEAMERGEIPKPWDH